MIWLVGARGMLGSEVAKQLATSGRPFLATDIDVDITDRVQIGAFLEKQQGAPLEWIVNCAAYTAVDRAEDEPVQAEAINGTAVGLLAAAARACGAAMLHVSTDYVFDGLKQGEYLETDEPNPIGAYGKSKLSGETELATTLEAHYILRTSWLFGRHGANFVNTMLRLFAERETVSVVADQWGSPTYAVDLAAAIVRVMTAGEPRYGIYHFSNEGRTSWFEFAREIQKQAVERGMIPKRATIRPITTAEYVSKAKRPNNSCMSKEKYKAAFGAAIRSWQEALDAYLEELSHAQAD